MGVDAWLIAARKPANSIPLDRDEGRVKLPIPCVSKLVSIANNDHPKSSSVHLQRSPMEVTEVERKAKTTTPARDFRPKCQICFSLASDFSFSKHRFTNNTWSSHGSTFFFNPILLFKKLITHKILITCQILYPCKSRRFRWSNCSLLFSRTDISLEMVTAGPLHRKRHRRSPARTSMHHLHGQNRQLLRPKHT